MQRTIDVDVVGGRWGRRLPPHTLQQGPRAPTFIFILLHPSHDTFLNFTCKSLLVTNSNIISMKIMSYQKSLHWVSSPSCWSTCQFPCRSPHQPSLSNSMTSTPITTSNIFMSIINRQSLISKVFSRYLHSPVKLVQQQSYKKWFE